MQGDFYSKYLKKLWAPLKKLWVPFFKLYQLLFTSKKSGTFDDVYLSWNLSKFIVNIFIKKIMFVNFGLVYQARHNQK